MWQKIFLQLVLWYLSLWPLPSLEMAIMGALYLWNTYILFQIQSREVIYTCNYICRMLFFQKYDGKTDRSAVWKLEQADMFTSVWPKSCWTIATLPFPQGHEFSTFLSPFTYRCNIWNLVLEDFHIPQSYFPLLGQMGIN